MLFERDIVPELKTLGVATIGEIAGVLGVSRQTLHRVMTGESAIITPDMAARLGKLCGVGRQSVYVWIEVWRVERLIDALKLARASGIPIERPAEDAFKPENIPDVGARISRHIETTEFRLTTVSAVIDISALRPANSFCMR